MTMVNPRRYDIRDWYWTVAGDATKVWSSAKRAYVPTNDAAFAKWTANGLGPPTPIATMEELEQMLTANGIVTSAK